MSDEVVTNAEESRVAPVAPEVAAPAPATNEEEDVATWKKRLAGKDQALTAAKKELDAIKAESDNLKRWKAEKENSNMSEFEKSQARLAALETELNQTREMAKMDRIKATHPAYAQFIADTAGLSDEARGAAFEGFMNALKKSEPVEPTRQVSDDNVSKPSVNTRKDQAASTARTVAEIEEELKKLGNPFFGM
jgi:hypothetical protein